MPHCWWTWTTYENRSRTEPSSAKTNQRIPFGTLFLELVPLGIDKARSIAVLSEKLGITREEVAAMGDGYNDLSMIKYAGLGIAMNNAQEPVKAAADYIAPSNDEDGVAIAVERYFLHAF